MKVVKIWASWCGPCKIYGPVFKRVKQEMESDNLTFESLDVDSDREGIKNKYKMSSIPFTALEDDNGNIVKTHPGMMREQQLKDFILDN